MKNTSDFVINTQERHHIICDVCGKQNYPDHRNPFIFFGFRCTDTGLFVGFDCRKKFYEEKNLGKYGINHINKYSETPVPVPWKFPPVIPNYGKQLTMNF